VSTRPARRTSGPTSTGPAASGHRSTSPFVDDGTVIASAVDQVSTLIATSPVSIKDPQAGSLLLQVYLAPDASGRTALIVEFCGAPPTPTTPRGDPYSYKIGAPGQAPQRIALYALHPDCLDPGSIDFGLLRRLVGTARQRSGMASSATVSWMVTGNHWEPAPTWIVKVDDSRNVATLTATLHGTITSFGVVPKARATPLPTFD
jgi:hypothetical protein